MRLRVPGEAPAPKRGVEQICRAGVEGLGHGMMARVAEVATRRRRHTEQARDGGQGGRRHTERARGGGRRGRRS